MMLTKVSGATRPERNSLSAFDLSKVSHISLSDAWSRIPTASSWSQTVVTRLVIELDPRSGHRARTDSCTCCFNLSIGSEWIRRGTNSNQEIIKVSLSTWKADLRADS